jgi:hypothetical protein
MNYPELKSERLLLRQLLKGDKDLVFQYRSDSITNQYQGFIPKSITDVTQWISHISSEFNIIPTKY